MYVLQCPACRADVLPSSLAHAWPQLQVGARAGGGGGISSGGYPPCMPGGACRVAMLAQLPCYQQPLNKLSAKLMPLYATAACCCW